METSPKQQSETNLLGAGSDESGTAQPQGKVLVKLPPPVPPRTWHDVRVEAVKRQRGRYQSRRAQRETKMDQLGAGKGKPVFLTSSN